jgi:hypothetical protein
MRYRLTRESYFRSGAATSGRAARRGDGSILGSCGVGGRPARAGHVAFVEATDQVAQGGERVDGGFRPCPRGFRAVAVEAGLAEEVGAPAVVAAGKAQARKAVGLGSKEADSG